MWILSRGKVVARDANGAPLRMIGTHTDITDRKKTEEAIKRERDKAQSYLDIAGVMIVVIDPGQNAVLANRKTCEVLGSEEKDIIGKNWFDTFIPEQGRDMIKGGFRDLMAGKIEPWEYVENPLLTMSGEERLIAWHNSVMRDEKGQIVATLSSGEDITDRKRAEEALVAAKRDWEDTFNSINDMVTIHDKDYNIIHYNTAAKRLLGLPNLVTSDVIKCYEYYHGKDCPPETCPSCGAFKLRSQEVFEFFEPHLNIFVEVRAIPRFSSDGELSGLVHVVRDITDRKISEKLLRIRLELLEFAATHSLDELLQKTLDEIGTLTNSPIGFYHFISEDEKTISLQDVVNPDGQGILPSRRKRTALPGRSGRSVGGCRKGKTPRDPQ